MRSERYTPTGSRIAMLAGLISPNEAIAAAGAEPAAAGIGAAGLTVAGIEEHEAFAGMYQGRPVLYADHESMAGLTVAGARRAAHHGAPHLITQPELEKWIHDLDVGLRRDIGGQINGLANNVNSRIDSSPR